MGLFGFVGKALGKIAKAGLSVATHGISDKVISGARAVIGGKPKRSAMVPYAGTSTAQERALVNKLQPITARVRVTERSEYKTKPYYKRKARTMATRSAGSPAKARSRTGTGRKPPSGGLDLRAMGQAFQAAGKPMPWQQWIKTNPIRKA